MNAVFLPVATRGAVIALLLIGMVAGCATLEPESSGAVRPEARGVEPAPVTEIIPEVVPQDAPTPIAPLRADVVLTVVRVRVSSADRARMKSVWDHLREDVIDSETVLRMRRNGFRVGVGADPVWASVKEIMDEIGPAGVDQPEPLRLPLGFPISLDLDEEPRDQTLFYLAADGVLSGQTWRESRNVLRLTFTSDPQRRRNVRLSLVPEVRQRLPGFRMVRTPNGLMQEPKYNGKAFETASFMASLAPGEFVMLAPSEKADVSGMIGRVFLTDEQEGGRTDSYFFLRPEPSYGK